MTTVVILFGVVVTVVSVVIGLRFRPLQEGHRAEMGRWIIGIGGALGIAIATLAATLAGGDDDLVVVDALGQVSDSATTAPTTTPPESEDGLDGDEGSSDGQDEESTAEDGDEPPPADPADDPDPETIATGDTTPPPTSQTTTTTAALPPDEEDDWPGLGLELGEVASSVVDENTLPGKLYRVGLTAGQTVRIDLSAPNDLGSLLLYGPSLTSLDTADDADLIDNWSVGTSFDTEYVPAVSGLYFVRLWASGPGQTYELSVTPTDAVPVSGAPRGHPGQLIELSTPVASVLDEDTHPQELYRVALTAGQTVAITLDAPNDLGSLWMYNPSLVSLGTADDQDISESWSVGKTFATEYTPAIDGEYFIALIASNPGQPFVLEVKPTGTVATSDAPADAPGQLLEVEASVTSVLDEDTRRTEVYRVPLTAGETVVIELNAPNDLGSLWLYNPSFDGFDNASDADLVDSWSVGTSFATEFTPAVDGEYSIALVASNPSQIYTLLVRSVG